LFDDGIESKVFFVTDVNLSEEGVSGEVKKEKAKTRGVSTEDPFVRSSNRWLLQVQIFIHLCDFCGGCRSCRAHDIGIAFCH